MAATNPPGGGGGSFFTRKLGPLPMWVWVALGVAGLYMYQQRKAAQAASAASQTQAQADAATSALANQGAAALQYGYSSPDLASMISNLQGQVSLLGGGNTGTTTTTPTSPGSTGNPANNPQETLRGSGYWVPNSEQVIYGQNGHSYQWIPNMTVLNALPRGTAVWIQPTPGFFSQSGTVGTPSAGAGGKGGTPLFLQVN